jgi:hypothetical protein
VKEYLLQCPHISPTSPVIKGTEEGLEKGNQCQMQDARLQAKFGGGTSPNCADVSSTDPDDAVVVEDMGGPMIQTDKYTSTKEDQDSMESQDVKQQKSAMRIQMSWLP